MAGILFTDSNLVLAGYSQHKQRIVGIGGKTQGSETPTLTAVREALEELFEFESLDETLIETVHKLLVFDTCVAYGKYTVYRMSFKDLQNIINAVGTYGKEMVSNVYNNLPVSVDQLVFNRKPYKHAELSHLVLLPCESSMKISACLLADIQTFNRTV